ncbi:hypothetical protein FD755_023367 [Muntiacus reevesi]|uniref:ABC transmembrane type-1 domain-containing protein n=1 Tax=Muntiacus reevesi TaxID=9886 RepID=A0A5N3VXL1_MUNRE|nr:hypothetical protein FD755_023367 [Muntiacus reevesi]
MTENACRHGGLITLIPLNIYASAVRQQISDPSHFLKAAKHVPQKNKNRPTLLLLDIDPKKMKTLILKDLCTSFRYSNWLDRLYMLLGTLAAIIHGAGLPLMMLVFGDMTDSFAGAGNKGNITFSNTTNASKCCLWY